MTQDEELTPAEKEALRQIVRQSLIPTPISAETQNRLIEMGYIEHTLRGLVATAKARAYLLPKRKRRKRIWRPN